MDIGTIGGILLGFGLIFTSLAMGESGIAAFFNVPGILIVFGGTIASTFIMFPMNSVLKTFKVAMNAFSIKLKSPQDTIKRFVDLSVKVRKHSVLALEKEQFDDKFLGKGIRLMTDGSKIGIIRNILTTELSLLKERHCTGQEIFEQMGSLAPAFGMIGTLIGLVQMLRTLSEPSAIGPAMAVALLTTFYGAVVANLFFIPIAKKLEQRSKEESLVKELIIEGIISLSSQDNPMVVKDKLEVFLAPHLRSEKKSNK